MLRMGLKMTDERNVFTGRTRAEERFSNIWYSQMLENMSLAPNGPFIWRKSKLQLAQEYAAEVRQRKGLVVAKLQAGRGK